MSINYHKYRPIRISHGTDYADEFIRGIFIFLIYHFVDLIQNDVIKWYFLIEWNNIQIFQSCQITFQHNIIHQCKCSVRIDFITTNISGVFCRNHFLKWFLNRLFSFCNRKTLLRYNHNWFFRHVGVCSRSKVLALKFTAPIIVNGTHLFFSLYSM